MANAAILDRDLDVGGARLAPSEFVRAEQSLCGVNRIAVSINHSSISEVPRDEGEYVMDQGD
jgi:hypothetical protein